MYPHQVFVLHSSYPDGTWRGLEKCSSTSEGPRVFTSADEAEAARVAMPEGDYFKVVEVTLVTPSVRGPLDSARWDEVNPLVPHKEVKSVVTHDPSLEKFAGARAMYCPVATLCFHCGKDIPAGSYGVFVQGKGMQHGECAP